MLTSYDEERLTLAYADTAAVTAASTDKYLEAQLSHPDYAAEPSIARGLKRADDAGIENTAVSAMQGQFLSVLARGIKAEKVLEIGTSAG